MVNILNSFQLNPSPGSFSSMLVYNAKGPATTPTSKSATVKFIIRYVLHLRNWRYLTKVMRVKALKTNTIEYSAIKTANQMVPGCTGELLSSVSLDFLKQSFPLYPAVVFTFIGARSRVEGCYTRLQTERYQESAK